MLRASAEELRPAAERIATSLRAFPECAVSVVAERSQPGSGAAPGVFLPTWAVRLVHTRRKAAALAAELRRAEPPVFVRVQDDALLFDPRSLLPGDEERLVSAVRSVLG